MSQNAENQGDPGLNGGSKGQAATLTRTPPPRVDHLPPYRVLLHNDDKNEGMFVVKTLRELVAMAAEQAFKVMDEADKTGVALVTVTHQERAEFLVDQFKSKGLTATCERAE